MASLRKQSGYDVVKILVNKFGFSAIRQRGSHMTLIKFAGEKKVGCVVPMHKELKLGTLKGVLEQAKIDEEEFAKYQ